MNEELLPIRLAIFASGQGTNAREIIQYFKDGRNGVLGRPIEIALIVSNKPGAGVLDIAAASGIPYIIIEKENFFH
jgi:phosphoribosylglycinamide formyltransferase-1